MLDNHTDPNTTQQSNRGKTMELDPQDLNTILAALRYYQQQGMGEPSNRPDWLHDIATNGDKEISLLDDGIDELCERLNGSK